MSAIEERKYFERKDHSLKILDIISKNKFLNKVIVLSLQTFFRLFNSGKKNSTKNIVIISLARLGDTVFTIPAIKVILEKYPEYKTIIICYPESESIYKLGLTGVSFEPVKKEEFKFGRRIAGLSARETVKKIKAEIIFDLTGTIASATLICNSGARQISGYNSEHFKTVYTHFTHQRKVPHLMDMYLDVVQLNTKFERTKELYEFKIKLEKDKKILIHPFAIRQAKEWNLQKFIQMAAHLSEDYNVEIISPENYVDDEVIDQIKKLNISFAVTKTIDELISAIKGCSAFISNDSGPTYIAALLGKPTFTMYGPTNPDYSLPFGKEHTFFRKILDCSPLKEQVCYTMAGIYCTHHNCLNLITVDEVTDAVKKYLADLKISMHKKQVSSTNLIDK